MQLYRSTIQRLMHVDWTGLDFTSSCCTLARNSSQEDKFDAWGPLMHVHVKRDGVGGYACGRQAVVVDGWPVRDGVAAAAYAASSILASAASKSECCSG